MAFVHEIQVVTRGFPGAPGYTNLYFATEVGENRDAQFAAVRQFFSGMSNLFPPLWTAQVAAEGRVLEQTTGLLAEFSVAPGTATVIVDGVAPGSFGAGVAGLCVSWGTGTVNRSRLVRGRTFLIPVSAGVYDGYGAIAQSHLDTSNGVAYALHNSGTGFGVWSRPVNKTGGLLAPVLTHHITNQAAFLSSRRS